MPKYKNERIAIIDDDSYQEQLDESGVDFLKIRRTMTFEGLSNENIQIRFFRNWRMGDTLYRISFEAFGTYDNWWTIALVNNKPTDAHFELGDDIFIPVRPNQVKNLMGS